MLMPDSIESPTQTACDQPTKDTGALRILFREVLQVAAGWGESPLQTPGSGGTSIPQAERTRKRFPARRPSRWPVGVTDSGQPHLGPAKPPHTLEGGGACHAFPHGALWRDGAASE